MKSSQLKFVVQVGVRTSSKVK